MHKHIRGFLLVFLVSIHIQCAPKRVIDLDPFVPSTPVVPKRLLLLVFDQMRPDFVERFDLKHFKLLAKKGVSYPNAIVGHLTSNTVVSHAVITTGLLPRNLPWQDNVLKDVGGLLGAKNLLYSTNEFTKEDFQKLLKSTEGTSLISRLGPPTFTLAQKFYAAMAFGAPDLDSVISLSTKRKADPLKGWKEPVGLKVPAFFNEPFGGRFYLDCNSAYGSENTLYPLDGNRFVPGNDPEHIGGDRWVADGVLKLMEKNPDWHGIFASFGAIDKSLHMLAEHDLPTKEPWALKAKIDLKSVLLAADEQLGRLLSDLEKRNLLQETLIVVTADHGGQANTHFHGTPVAGSGLTSFEFGHGQNFESPTLPASLKKLQQTGLIDFSAQGSYLSFWLKKKDKVAVARFGDLVREAPGVAEVYTGNDTGRSFHYVRNFRSKELTDKSLEWAKAHNQDLIASIAAKGSPDVVALLLDGHGYAVKGDHGGAQESVQRIPLYIVSPNLKERGVFNEMQVRLVDVNPIITRLMHLPKPQGLDGSSIGIEDFLETVSH